MKDKPKILVGCPVSKVKDYVLYYWYSFVQNLTYPNYDIYLVDNSENPDFAKELQRCGIQYSRYYNPSSKPQENMAGSLEVLRKKAIKENYDYFMSIECDIFPPRNVIEKLLSNDVGVVGAVYLINHGYEIRPMLQEIVMVGANNAKVFNIDRNTCLRMMDGELKDIYSCGLGCTLIETGVLKNIKFRVDINVDDCHADSYFFQDLWKSGVRSYVDTSIMAKHYNQKLNIRV